MGTSPDKKLQEYQKNMKLFVAAVEKEIAAIIFKYQKEIKELKQEN